MDEIEKSTSFVSYFGAIRKVFFATALKRCSNGVR